MNLSTAAELLIRLKIGPREGLVLGVIAEMKGAAQGHHLKARLAAYSKDPQGVAQILRRKGLIKTVENPAGFPFWDLTAEGERAIAKAKEGLEP